MTETSKQFFDTAKFVLGSLVIAMASSASFADDGGITFGGSPHLLSGHPSVSMKSEAVSVDVHEKLIKVDCNFVFHNAGPACTVRVGFPDEGQGAAEPYQGEEVPKGPGLKASFLSYESYVDGKKVATQLVPTADRSLYWHAKTVNFKANSDCLIRDVYTVAPGAQVTSENGMYQQTSYILHTGASWNGPIGKAEIKFVLEPDVVKEPLQLKSCGDPSGHEFLHLKWSKLPVGTVVYEGPSKPTVSGHTILFEKSKFKPSKKDDIRIYYAYRKLSNMQ